MKIIKYVSYGLIYFFVLILLTYCVQEWDSLMRLMLGSYPALGTYYINFDENENGEVVGNVYYKQEIYNEVIDLSNLQLYISKSTAYALEESNIYSDKEIRKMLLEGGYAQIIDPQIASKDELRWENKAVRLENFWCSIEEYTNILTIHELYCYICDFCYSNMGKLIKMLIFTLISSGGILKIIKILISRKKVDVVFMGAIASGKTSIIKRMEKPNITEVELKEMTPTKAKALIKCERVPYKNKDIYPCLFDNPGNNYGKMIDDVNKFGPAKSNNKVIVFVITFTMSPTSPNINFKVLNSQISKAAVLTKIFKTSDSIKKVRKIIVYFNKCDLIYQNELDFRENPQKAYDILRSSTDYRELERYADEIVYGSALKGWNMQKLKDSIIS